MCPAACVRDVSNHLCLQRLDAAGGPILAGAAGIDASMVSCGACMAATTSAVPYRDRNLLRCDASLPKASKRLAFVALLRPCCPTSSGSQAHAGIDHCARSWSVVPPLRVVWSDLASSNGLPALSRGQPDANAIRGAAVAPRVGAVVMPTIAPL